jgi:hypothetical protein
MSQPSSPFSPSGDLKITKTYDLPMIVDKGFPPLDFMATTLLEHKDRITALENRISELEKIIKRIAV